MKIQILKESACYIAERYARPYHARVELAEIDTTTQEITFTYRVEDSTEQRQQTMRVKDNDGIAAVNVGYYEDASKM